MLYPHIDPVIVQLGPVAVHWYGVMYLIGFTAAWLLARRRARQPGSVVSVQQVEDLIFYCALGVVLGGRTGYVLFYDLPFYFHHPLQIFAVWDGGMSFHGGLLGVLLAMWLFCRKYRLNYLAVGDFVVPLVPLGLLAGRIGNFINGELWGKPSDLPWAMRVPCAGHYDLCFDKLRLPPGTLLTPPLNPSQLYEASLEGVLLFIVLWWFSSRPRTPPAVAGLFLLGYGTVRFLVEFVRMPDPQLGYLAFGWLTMGQVLSVPMILAGVGLLWWARRRAHAGVLQ